MADSTGRVSRAHNKGGGANRRECSAGAPAVIPSGIQKAQQVGITDFGRVILPPSRIDQRRNGIPESVIRLRAGSFKRDARSDDMHLRKCLGFPVLTLLLGLLVCAAAAEPPAAAPPTLQDSEILRLKTGDEVKIEVFGHPEMAIAAFVAPDGTMPIPQIGAVQVGGLLPSEAATRIESAVKAGRP
jgi:hypothetical protein